MTTTPSDARLIAVLGKPKLFVTGYAKSGTTWAQLMLDAHPAIACKGEGHLANVLARELEASLQRYGQFIAGKNQTIFKEIEGFPLIEAGDVIEIVRAAACQLMGRYGADDAVEIVGEKTPDTMTCLPQMRQVFPEGKFLFIHRDGRDVLASLIQHNIRTGGAPTTGNRSIEEFAGLLGQDWATRVLAAHELCARAPDIAMEFKYEDCLDAPEDTLSGIFNWLGVDASEQVVASCVAKASFAALSGGRQIGEEDKSSHFRKGGTGNWQEELTASAVSAFESAAENTLRIFGYVG